MLPERICTEPSRPGRVVKDGVIFHERIIMGSNCTEVSCPEPNCPGPNGPWPLCYMAKRLHRAEL